MSSHDLTKRRDHPLGSTDDAVERGRRERAAFGADKQSGQQPSESWAEYQRRLHGTY